MFGEIEMWDIVGYLGLLAFLAVVVAIAAWSLLGPVLTLLKPRRKHAAPPPEPGSVPGAEAMPPDPFFR